MPKDLRYILIGFKMVKLSDYIRSVMAEKSLSLSDVQKRSRGKISFGYVNDLVNEKSLNPTVAKLQALALGLGVPEETIFRIARGLPIEPEENATHAQLIETFKRLSPNRQNDALKMIELLEDLDQSPALIPLEFENPATIDGSDAPDYADELPESDAVFI